MSAAEHNAAYLSMGLYKKPTTPFWYACWLEPVTEGGRMKRRPDGTVVTRQIHRSTKEEKKTRAEPIFDRWEQEAKERARWNLDEELDRLRVRKVALESIEEEKQEAKRRTFTLSDLRELWLKHAALKKSLVDDRDRFAVIIEILGADKPIADLTVTDVFALRDALLVRKTKRGKKGHSPATINRYFALLRSSLKAAELQGHEHRNPMRGVKLLREDNKRDRICSRDEYEKLIAAARPELRLAIVFAYHAPLRLGDIVALDWSRIDLKERLVRILASNEKTGAGRNVPINSEIVEELMRVAPKKGPLFAYAPRKGGTDHGPGPTISSWFSELTEELEIDDLHFHDLKHTSLTNLRRAGTDIFALAEMAGHKDLQTMARYQNVSLDDLREAVERTAAKARDRKPR